MSIDWGKRQRALGRHKHFAADIIDTSTAEPDEDLGGSSSELLGDGEPPRGRVFIENEEVSLHSFDEDGETLKARVLVKNDQVRLLVLDENGDDEFEIHLTGTMAIRRYSEGEERASIYFADDEIRLELRDDQGDPTNALVVDDDGVRIDTLPVVDPEVAGRLWNDGGTVKISAGA